jgi:hypothetical protein
VLVLQAPLDAARRQWLTAIAGALVSLQNQLQRDLAAAAQQERERHAEEKRLVSERQREQLEEQLRSRRRGASEGFTGAGGTPRLDISTLAGLPLSSLTEEIEEEEGEDEEGEEEQNEWIKQFQKQPKMHQRVSPVSRKGSSSRASRAFIALALLKAASATTSSTSSGYRDNNVNSLATSQQPSSSTLRKSISEQQQYQQKSKKQARTSSIFESSSSSSSSISEFVDEDQREMIARLAKEAVQAYVLSSAASSSQIKDDGIERRDDALSAIQTKAVASAAASSAAATIGTVSTMSSTVPPRLSRNSVSTQGTSSSSLLSSSALSVSSLSTPATKGGATTASTFISSSSPSSLSPRTLSSSNSGGGGGGGVAVGNLSHATPAAVQMRRRLATLSPCPPLKGTEPGGPSSSFKPLPFARPTTLTAKAAEELMKRKERLTKLAIDFANAANGNSALNLVDDEIVNRLAVVWASERALKDLLSGDASNDFSNATSSSWKTLGN